MPETWTARFPDGWWGYHWAPPRPMSAVEIIGSGTLDARLMATVWAVMARRRSLMCASEPPLAGKTTTLTAAAGFLPPGTVPIFLRGWSETLDGLDRYGPQRAYLLASEISDHLPIYVWGRSAQAALRLAGRGYGLGATMHADSLDEAIALLRWALAATDLDLGGLTLYLQFSAYRLSDGIYRRVEEAWHLRLTDDGALAPVRLAVIAGGRSPSLRGAQRLPVPPQLASDGGRRGAPLDHDPAAYATLARSLATKPEALDAELAERAAFLVALGERGIRASDAVARAIRSYPHLPAAPAGIGPDGVKA